jgi:hypothetical protein
MKMDFFKKHKSDMLFLLGGIVLLVVTAYFFVQSLHFLIVSVNKALAENGGTATSQQFNLEGLVRLGIMQPSPSPAAQVSPAASPSPVQSTSTPPSL